MHLHKYCVSHGVRAKTCIWEAYPKTYNQGDKVVHQNVLYEAQTGPIWVTPGSGEHWWKTIGSCN